MWGATESIFSNKRPLVISIHAPVWGATLVSPSCSFVLANFNSRSRVGSDMAVGLIIKFQIDFNSRSRVGSDYQNKTKMKGMIISIHAPVWGATCIKQ